MDVWMDDMRPAPNGWVWTRTVEETIKVLELGEVEYLSLDNDLGDGLTEGYNVTKWMEANDVWPPVVLIHSANVVAVDFMSGKLEASGRYAPPLAVKVGGYTALMYRLTENT